MNPTGPAHVPSRWKADKNSFAVSPSGEVLPPELYDPRRWHILVLGGT